MPRFSQRYGYSPLERAFQREKIDEALRTALWNILKVSIWDTYKKDDYYYPERSKRIDSMVRRLWLHFFNNDLDDLPEFQTRYSREPGSYDRIKVFFFSCAWFEVYDLLEEISTDVSDLLSDDAREVMNLTLEKHNAAYRLLDNTIVEITDQNEIAAIEEGLEHPDLPVRTHLEAALRMLSDKEMPDYRNSIKESISAVEAACRLITGDKSATLGDALKRINHLHPSLSQAFTKLYGYTSDNSGIRHSLVDDPNTNYTVAKFMLVACSAFVSYLKVNASSVPPAT